MGVRSFLAYGTDSQSELELGVGSCPCNGERTAAVLSTGGDSESSIVECTGAGFVEKLDAAHTARRVQLVGNCPEDAVFIGRDFERSCSGIGRLSDEHDYS
jgi:hypothetical protein